ncbi:MAG: hypothetical protein J6N19_00535 [Clostridium sp.]|nr:hypothetical protein [Clostridium sp.]
MKPSSFNIYCMSYKRANRIMTKNFFEYCTYVVREEEAEAYREAGVEDLLVIPKGAVYSFMSTLYWIIQNTPEDLIYIADDDIIRFMYRMDDKRYLELEKGVPDKEMITSEIERIGQLILDLDIGLAFDNAQPATYVYHSEFEFKGMPGHMRWINKNALKAKYDRKDPATSDVDMMMQELLNNRIILQPRYLCVDAFMDTNEGEQKTRQRHLNVVEAMKQKWGRYFGYNYKKNTARINVKR